MSVAANIAEGLAPLVDLVYPPRCPLCGVETGRQGGLCVACWSELEIPGEPSCAACSRPLPGIAQGPGAICAVCLKDPPKHAGIHAATLYNEPSRKLVLALKHGGKIGLAPQLALIIASRIPDHPPGEAPAVLIPVPLHRWRLWRRGYNQAALLASELAKLAKGTLCVDGLIRTRPTPALGGLGRKERRRVLQGAIAVNPKRTHRLRGQDVILVDDVLTSGATSEVCVRALLRAGARSVRIACFARVLDEALGQNQAPLDPENETPEA